MTNPIRTSGVAGRLVALVVALALFLTLVVAVAARGSAAPTRHLTLFDIGSSGTTEPVDLLTEGDFPGLGDLILEYHDLADMESQAIVGQAITRVQVIHTLPGGDFDLLIDCTVLLAEGTFHFTGGGRFSDFTQGQGITLPIVGGTGVYRQATGTVHMIAGELGGDAGGILTAEITSRK